MALEAERIAAEALDLPAEDRAELVQRLLKSLDDEGDSLEPQDRERLHAAIARSDEQFKAGQDIPADEVLKGLHDR